jgi:hypothetical protein
VAEKGERRSQRFLPPTAREGVEGKKKKKKKKKEEEEEESRRLPSLLLVLSHSYFDSAAS